MTLIKATIGIAFAVPFLRLCFRKYIYQSSQLAFQKIKEMRERKQAEREKSKRELDSALYIDA